MKYLKINLKTVAFFWLTTMFSIYSYAQEAENIYHKQYSKLSFVLQPSILKPSEAYNYDGSAYPSVEFTKDFSYQFGVYYNFAQSGNFNFKTGIIAKEFIPKFDLNITDQDIGMGVDYTLTEIDSYSQFLLSIPLKMEYFIKINPKLNLSLGSAINMNIITGTNFEHTTGVSVYSIDGSNSKDIFYSKSVQHQNLNFSTELSLGFNYKTKYALFDLSYFINNQFGSKYTTGEYQIYNLTQSETKNGQFNIYSSFHGLSLVVSPKKGWLKNSTKKEL